MEREHDTTTAEEWGPAHEVPVTGDPTIDAVVSELAEAREQPLEAHIAAGEKAHRVLQARLSDLGGE
jgi:hypothetical protein